MKTNPKGFMVTQEHRWLVFRTITTTLQMSQSVFFSNRSRKNNRHSENCTTLLTYTQHYHTRRHDFSNRITRISSANQTNTKSIRYQTDYSIATTSNIILANCLTPHLASAHHFQYATSTIPITTCATIKGVHSSYATDKGAGNKAQTSRTSTPTKSLRVNKCTQSHTLL